MTTPAPPPARRKEKPINTLKVIQTEQSQKLQQKHALEQELLEDIRAYSKTRAGIEREYAQGLQKMVTQFMQKFAPKTLEVEEVRTPFGLWRRMLEETDEMAKSRLTVAQNLVDLVAEDIKALKSARTQTIKKCVTLTEALHQEMQVSVQDLSNCQKNYSETRKAHIQTSEQASEARTKLKKGTGTFFHSKAKLEKNASKLEEKREISHKKALVARNDYLLSLAAANAHQIRYYTTDLPGIIAVQDGNIYEKFKDYFSEMVKLEIDNLGKHLNTYSNFLSNVNQLQRAHALEVFLQKNQTFTRCEPYEFQAFRDDAEQKLSDKCGDDGVHLDKEARKWATRLTREQKLIDKKTRELRTLQTQQSDQNENKETESVATGQAMSDLAEEIRHREVLKTKADARLELLRQAGVNVDNWLTSAMQEQQQEENEEVHGEDEDAEYDWEDDREFLSPENDEDDNISETSLPNHLLKKVIAIYSFQAAGEEELSITANEELELIEKDVDGWMKGRNSLGQVGFFPESYVELKAPPSIGHSISGEIYPLTQNCASQEKSEEENRLSNSSEAPAVAYICSVRALYDYTATEDEELTFKEGDVIMVTNKNEQVDDGWWEGIFDNKKGTFPNIVVEEIGSGPEDIKEWPIYEGKRALSNNGYASLPRLKSNAPSSLNRYSDQYQDSLTPPQPSYLSGGHI